MATIRTKIMRLPHGEDLPLQMPTPSSLDLLAAVNTPPFAPVVIAPGERAAIPTGLVVEVPPGTVGQIWPRSGPALRHGVGVLNSIVDADYRGEVQVILINLGERPYTVERGVPVARFVITPVLPLDCEMVSVFGGDDDIRPPAEQSDVPRFSVLKSDDGQPNPWAVTLNNYGPNADSVATVVTFATEAEAQAWVADKLAVDVGLIQRW